MLSGRDTDMARLRAAVARGRSAVVRGPAGVGKTALVTAFAAGLDRPRFCVIRVLATQACRAVPFGALSELAPGDGPAEGTFAMARVAGEVARRAGRGTPVLVVDDAHLLDGPSAAVVLRLAASGSACVVATVRSGETPPDAVAALWKDHAAELVELEPFDRAGTQLLLGALLGGVAAGSTVDLLHQWTGGNPLFLTELVRAGRADGQLGLDSGLWWWRSRLTVPAGLADLLDRRVDGLTTEERDALAAVSLGEPLAIEVLEAVAAPSVAARLEDLDLVRTHDALTGIRASLDHPLLSASVRRRLSPARRRRVAARLLAATRAGLEHLVDPVAQALWQLEAHGDVDVDVLLGGAEASLHSDPSLAVRLAERALVERWSVPALTAVADGLVELGEPARARAALERGLSAARSPADVQAVATALAAHRAWAERDPHGAHCELEGLRTAARRHRGAVVDAGSLAEVDSVDALVLLFAARTAEALVTADRVLGQATLPRRARVRALLVQAAGRTLTGDTTGALAAAEPLAGAPASVFEGLPYARGMSLAARALAQLWRTPAGEVPATDPLHGRWPTPRDPATGLAVTAWPLFDGYVHRVVGDSETAVARLREALVQQSGGEGLFRSEAAAWLALTLAETGRPDEAAEVLAGTAPDDVAIVPGLGPWAQAALAAARGQRQAAASAMAEAVAAAHASGCWLVELGYLTYTATEHLDSTARTADLPARIARAMRHVDAARLLASAEATIVALRPDPDGLLDHARRLREHGLTAPAIRLAEGAQGHAAAAPRVRAEASELAAAMRVELGRGAAVVGQHALTRREAEIAELAGAGMTDAQIAQHLVLSVRTVETHLGRVYRKLGVTSRRELRR